MELPFFALHIMLDASFTQLNVAMALTIPDDIICKELLSFLTGN
jgi:hypothetical protein